MALQSSPRTIPCVAMRFLGVMVDTTNLEELDLDLGREGGKSSTSRRTADDSARAGAFQDQLPPCCEGFWRSAAASDRHRPLDG